MRWIWIAATALALTGCEGEPTEPVTDIEAMNDRARGSVESIELQPITFAMIEEHNLFGAGCNFIAEGSDDLVLIADGDRAYFFLDGEPIGASSDPGSEPSRYGAWTHYDGLEYAVEMSFDPATEDVEAPEVVNYDGVLAIKDAQDRVAYRAEGTVQCGA